MERSARVGTWIIATGVIVAFLYLGRDILATFAMAVFLYLIIEGFATVIEAAGKRAKVARFGMRAARLIAVLIVTGGFVAFIALLANGFGEFGRHSEEYETKINLLIADAYRAVGLGNAPTLTQLLLNETGQQFFATLANAVSGLSGDLVLILIYVAFLFAAQGGWSRKLDAIFRTPERREQVRVIGEEARLSIERYLWVQTVISALITLLSYVSLLALGVQNALFLSALIFVLNYIPTVGSIVAALVPPLFALVQPSVPGWVPGFAPDTSYIYAALVFVIVSFWQFSIGNFVQPRMMGDSLNLSALVVLLALAIWGLIWGIPGMFLSAPLTVLMMILLAQSDQTRWMAVLLSSDGNPRGKVEQSEVAVSASRGS
ncbi:AI-2E family transporter [Hyphomonas sp.]|uniref:AI-2E family transporter n=1 Tax=Hyphomonas sp. TaxID=87 RepID=UPI00391DB260